MTYAELHKKAFDKPPEPPQQWFHCPFAWGTPESDEVQNVLYGIESRTIWKQLLTALRDEKIEGDLVEFGVSVGGSLEMLIQHADDLGLKLNIYGFDSFEGLPEPSPTLDLDCWKKGDYAASCESVARRLKVESRPHVSLVKGWFSDSLARPDIRTNIRRVAFARIDCDLYEPAVECLEFLESRLVDGAVLSFDDWTDNPEKGETRAFFEFFARVRHKFRFQAVCRISIGGMHMRVFRIPTRREALAEGALVDLTRFETIRHYWKFPFACTAEVWRMIESAAGQPGLDTAAVLHDISAAAQAAAPRSTEPNAVRFEANLAGRSQPLKLRIGPGDDAAPVLTLMLPDQN